MLAGQMQNHENFASQFINRLESKQSQLANSYWNEETLSYQSLANSDIFDFIDMIQELCHFENQDSISSYQPELDQNQILDILASYPFLKLNLKMTVNLNLNLAIRVQSLNQSFHPLTTLSWMKIKIQFHYIHWNLPKFFKTTLIF